MKKNYLKFLVAVLASFMCVTYSNAQYGTITTVAGSGCYGSFAGDGGAATASAVCFNGVSAVAVGRAGDIFIADLANYRIRKVNAATGILNTIAGIGSSGFSGDGGSALGAHLGTVTRICTDRSGNCYVIDASNYRIRKIDHSSGIITTVAGNGSGSYSGDGAAATSAGIRQPVSVCVDTNGNIYFSDSFRVRKVTVSTGIINTIAGDGTNGFSGDGGPATAATLDYAHSIACDIAGNLYISDYHNGRIRKVNTSGIITTIAGDGSTSYRDGCAATTTAILPLNITTDGAGNVYFNSGLYDQAVTKLTISTGVINKLAVTGGGYLAGDNVCVDSAGIAYMTDGINVTKITGAASGIDTWSVDDSLASAACSIPGTVALGMMGIITGTPSATDSLSVSVDYGDAYFSSTHIRNYMLPYWYASGHYGFGSAVHNVGNYTYRLPGIYYPYVELRTLGGYYNAYYTSPDTIGSGCSTSSVTGITSFDVWDTLISSPCVFPSRVDFVASGTIAGTPSSTDSVYIAVVYEDSAMAVAVVPYTLSGSTYSFTYSFSHIYTTAGTFSPTLYAITSSGVYTLSSMAPANVITNCSGGAVTIDMHTNYGGIRCGVPDTESYAYFGQVYDSAMLSPTSTMHVYFGDGTDTSITVPVINDGHGAFTFNTGMYVFHPVEHIFSMPGVYNSRVIDTTGSYVSAYTINYPSYSYGFLDTNLVIGAGCSPLSGTFYIDSNSNCSIDAGEVPLSYWPYALINNTLGDTTYGWCNDSGMYSINVISGYTYTLVSDPSGTFGYYGSAGATVTPSCPTTGTHTFTPTSGSTVVHHFAFTCHTPTAMDMSVSGWGWGFVAGDTGVVGVWSSNAYGFMCDTLSSDVTLVLDTNLAYRGMWSGPAPTHISGDTLTWHFTTVGSLFDFSGYVKVTTDTTATVFDTIRNRLFVAPTRISDPVTSNNTYLWNVPVVASWDPNEKQVSPQGYGPQGYIPNGTPLSYIVHFQNTGSAPARNITLSDTISRNLDLSTLQVVSSSSAVLVYQMPGNVIKFRFNDINLPDSSSDPMGSIGYIAYNIVPHDSLAPNTQITNKAGIYFDYNPAVYTNVILNTIEDTIGVIHGADTVCAGISTTFTNHIAGGVWSVSNTHASVSGGIVTGLTPGLDTITYTVYGHQSATKTIFVRASPSFGTVIGSSSVCAGGTTTLSATVAGGSWSSTSAGRVSVSGTGVVTGIAAGADTVFYTSTNVCGTGTARFAMTVDLSPVQFPAVQVYVRERLLLCPLP